MTDDESTRRSFWHLKLGLLAITAILTFGYALSPTGTGVTNGTDATAYAFISSNDDGSPGRFNPCEPIRYVVNDTQADPGAVDDVAEAFARIAEATGLTFEFTGTTDAIPTTAWAIEASSDGAWPPVLIGWAHPGQTDMLSGSEAGSGGPDVMTGSDGKVFVTGSVVIDATRNDVYRPGFGLGSSRGGLLMHELGHVVGLSHVEDAGQIMYDTTGPRPARFAAGDRAGLAAVGAAGGCLLVPPAPTS